MILRLPALPYALDALEPHISRRTMVAHYTRHHAGYVDKTRALVQGTSLERATLGEIVKASAHGEPRLFNAAAQAWNHEFFWNSMQPDGGGEPHGLIADQIERTFGSQAAFKEQFITAAMELFGSGWVWLIQDEGKLRITTTGNAGTPMVDNKVPLLTLDVWEHSYYLDYEHQRLQYVTAFLAHLVDWEAANRRMRGARHISPATQGL